MKRYLSAVIIFLITISSLFGQSTAIAFQEQTTEIKIGGLFPLTGSLALGGKERESAFRMAIQQINNDPTLLPGKILVPLTQDTGTDPHTGEKAAQDLIDNGVVALIGASSSAVSAAIAGGPSKDNQIPQISYSSTTPSLSNKTAYPYFLRVVPSDILQIRGIVELVNYFGWDYISIIRSANIYSQAVSSQVGSTNQQNSAEVGVNSFESEAKNFNIQVVQTQVINTTMDITPQLRQIKLFGSNIILLNVYLADAIKVFEVASDLGMTSKEGYVWIGTDSASQSEVLEASSKVNDAMQGLIGLKPLQPQNAAFTHFLDLWEQCAGRNTSEYFGCGDRNPNIYAPFAYDATYFLAHAIQKMVESGQDYTNGELLLTQLKSQTIDGITGKITLDQNGDRLSGYDVINVQGNNFVDIGTWEIFNGVTQNLPVFWQGSSEGELNTPIAKLASSWILLISLVLLPLIIYFIRKVWEFRRRKVV